MAPTFPPVDTGVKGEAIARALYAYDDGGRPTFDEADADTLAPYFDMAELALEAMRDVQ